MSDNRVESRAGTQRERDQAQAMADLDQSIAERAQVRADCDQQRIDEAQEQLDADSRATHEHDVRARASLGQRQAELSLAQDSLDAHQTQLDDSQRRRGPLPRRAR